MSTAARSAASVEAATKRVWAACMADQEDPGAVLTAITDGAAVNDRLLLGYSPLHLTAMYDQAATAQILLQAGAAVDAKDQQEETPLFIAVCNEHTALAQLLVQAGADPLAANNAGLLADTDLVITTTVLADPQTAPATCELLRVHAVRHLADQPALAARLIELITARG